MHTHTVAVLQDLAVVMIVAGLGSVIYHRRLGNWDPLAAAKADPSPKIRGQDSQPLE